MGHDKTRRPVGTEGMHAVNDSDRPTAGGPVGRLFNSDPLGPSGMPSLDKLYQPLAVGPVGQPFITSPLGNHVSESDCRRTNRINSGPGGSTGVLDPVNQTGSDVQTDRLSIGTINGPANSGDTPPSSDSGVHSWEEQWENMSEHSTDGTSEQTVRSNYGSSRRGHMSDIRAPPKTEEKGDSDYPRADRLLSKELDGSSSNVVYGEDRRFLFNAVTGYGSDSSVANSGKLGRNSDIAALSDFSDDMEETGVRRLSGCRIPGCKFNGHVVNMKWGSDGLSDMYNSECETNASDRVLQTEQESPKLVPTVQPILVADDVIPIPRINLWTTNAGPLPKVK